MKRDFPKLIEEWVEAEAHKRFDETLEVEFVCNAESRLGPDIEIFVGRKLEGVDREDCDPWLLSEELLHIALSASTPEDAERVAKTLDDIAKVIRDHVAFAASRRNARTP